MAYTTGGRTPLRQQLQLEGGVEALSLTDDLQLDDLSANYLAIDGGLADREIRMPAENRPGSLFYIVNTGGANALNLRTSTGASVSGFGPGGGVDSLAPSQAALCAYDPVAGWAHFGVVAVTL